MTKNIATALAKAQMNMGKALKQSANPAFKSKYADLSNVIEACLPALNEAGIALIQPTGEDDHGRYVETVLIHGESGESLSCRVPLIIAKHDMQGYGSAVTYARRYGLMALTGIAPEDDDGNAAAASARKTILPAQVEELAAMIGNDDELKAKITTWKGVKELDEILAVDLEAVVNGVKKYQAAKKAKDAKGQPADGNPENAQ